MEYFAIGDTRVPSEFIPRTQTIVDSGTTLMVLPDSMYASVMAAFKSNCSLKCTCTSDIGCGLHSIDDMYYKCMSADEIDAYPAITIGLGNNVTLQVPPSVYLVPKPGDPRYRVLGIERGGASSDVILGQSMMRAFQVVFDRGNKRVGFGSINASYCGVNCADLKSENSCMKEAYCGWCKSEGVCMEGDSKGPFEPLSCDAGWHMSQSCPNLLMLLILIYGGLFVAIGCCICVCCGACCSACCVGLCLSGYLRTKRAASGTPPNSYVQNETEGAYVAMT